jgi:glycosyltransferase involved in cell wall biosynthesis
VKALAAGPGSRPRNVLHVIVPEPEGSVGGADMHVRDLASAQRQQGTVTPLVFETLSPTFARRVRETGVECISTAGKPRRAILPTLRRLLVERRIDIVHAHGYDGTWWALGALSLVRSRPKFMVTCHGWIETSVRLKLMSALDRAANRAADAGIVVSDELIPQALRTLPRARAFAAIPNGVPILPVAGASDIRRRLGLPAQGPLVGAIGRFSPEKAHDVFLDASAMLAQLRPDVHFVLGGGGPLLESLRARADRLGIGSRVHLVGVVDDTHVLLHELNVVVQPSDSETTSRLVLEAMVQERAVVATRVGGTESIITHGESGMLVPPRSPDAIAARVLDLLDKPAVASRLGRTAREIAAAKFDIDTMARAVDEVYLATSGTPVDAARIWVRETQAAR